MELWDRKTYLKKCGLRRFACRIYCDKRLRGFEVAIRIITYLRRFQQPHGSPDDA